MVGERLAAHFDGLGNLVGQVALVRQCLEELGARRFVGQQAVAQRGAVVHCRLAVRSEPGCFLRCTRRMLGDSGCVTATLRVVRQSAMVGYVMGHQVVENGTMHLLPARRWHRLVDHLTRELVPERHVVTGVEEYSELDAFVQCSRCFARCGR